MESTPDIRTIEAAVHGRYLVRAPGTPAPWPAIFSFHGYGEDAATNLVEIERIPGISDWLIVAVQALHPFYTKSERVVASWMTRQDRELAIADNIRYVEGVVDAVTRAHSISRAIVFAGFSQGAAMAYRSAARIGGSGVIALGGDVPPDITGSPGRSALPHVLIGRGTNDEWYTEQKMSADLERLRDLAASAQPCVFTGGHQWTAEFAAEAGRFLERLRSAP